MGRLLGLLLCTCLLFSLASVFATGTDDLPLGVQDHSRSQANLSVTRISPEMTSISLETPVVVTQEEMVDYHTYKTFGVPGEYSVMEVGSPSVPQIARFYRIPNTGGADLVITDAEYDVVDNVDPLPVQPEQPGFQSLTRDESLYSSDGWYPANVAVMSDPMIMRDFRLVQVTLYPVQVNPITHQARIYRHLSVDVVATSQPGVNELLNPRRPSGDWASVYRSTISNLDDNALDDVTTTPGSLMILTGTSTQMRPWADSLAEWKTRKGFRTVVDARANWTSSSAVQAIQTAYNTWDPPLEYVMLMGDPGGSSPVGIPVGPGSYDFDHVYANMTAGDNIEDIAVGRWSAATGASMATIWAKEVAYERTPHMQNGQQQPDTMWYHKSFLYAGIAQGMAGNYLLMRWAKDQFIHNTGVYIDSVQTHSGDGIINSDVTNQVNAGIGYFLWRGSWVGGMPSNIADLTNPGGRYPITMTVTCSAGNYSNSAGVDSPAEDFLVAGTATNPKGGVCGMGTSTNGTENGPNVVLANALIYFIADALVEHMGTATANAKAELYRAYGPNHMDYEDSSVPTARKFTGIFNLLGDPSLSMWTDVPESLTVVHPTALSVGDRSVSVTVTRRADGIPVQGALVCLWKKNPDSTWVRGLTDDQGHLTLPVNVNASGNMYLTVTKRNHQPYLYTIPCSQVGCMPMYSSVTLDDDNGGGTQGNGNGIMNPGETIDLRTYIRNFGNGSTATGISATLTSTDSRVTVQTGTASYVNLAPGDSALGSVPFRIHVAQDLQNAVQVLLTLTVNSSAGQTVGAIPLTCQAGDARYLRHSLSTAFNPGVTANLSVVVRNTGPLAMTGVTGHLVSLSPFVQADDANAAFGDIASGALDSNTTDVFTITSNSMTFRGLQAPMRLVLTTSDGFADTTQFIIPVGTALTTDPTGPDADGYYAYDNTDVSYEMHPTYNYVDISSTGGTNLTLNDPGDKTSPTPVYSTTRRLPFGFKFYGRVYDTLTVCSNGWCAFGNQAYLDMFRNDMIPSMGAPDAMIAPYWDDLATSGGSGRGVWVKNDSTNHCYIIQWKAGVGSGYSTPLDFEVILYDTTYNPTMDGNGQILMQYNVVTINLNNHDAREPAGSTTGIQAPGSLVGLGYLYRNIYSPGAATMAHGTAILFTTDARMLFGRIQGTVLNVANNQPMSGVNVGVNGYAYHASTDVAGHYLIPNVLIGTYGLHASFRRFNNDSTVNEIVVQLDSTATANFSLRHPEMALSVDSLVDSIGATPAQTTFDILNAGNGPLDYDIQVFFAGAHSPNPWDSVGNVTATQQTGNYQLWGCEFAADNWWVTGSGGGSGPNLLYRFDLNGNLVGSVPQPATSAFGWFDLAYDGHYLYGSDSHVIYGIDLMTGQVRDTIPSPLNPTRAIAYDSTSGHFWVADYTSDIYELDRQGGVVNQISNAQHLAITGLAWNATDANGYKLYIFSQDGSTTHARLTRMLTTTPYTLQTVVDLPTLPGDRAGGCTITPAWNSTLLVFGGILRGANGPDHLEIYQMTFNSTWISATPAQWNVPGGTSGQITVHFDPATLRDGSYRVDLHIASTVYDTTMVLPVRLIVNRGGVKANPHTSVLPTRYALHQNFPNPFNPTTTIRYELKNEGLTRLSVYNLLGEQVADLVNAKQPTGFYEVNFNASELPSGVYFYRITSGSFTQSAKMFLMK